MQQEKKRQVLPYWHPLCNWSYEARNRLASGPLESPSNFEDPLSREINHLNQETRVKEYAVDVVELASKLPSPEAGNNIDLGKMLCGGLVRINGDRFSINRESFKKKHVLVCCFHLPYSFPYRSEHLYALVNLGKELYSTRREDFEMVMVARMNFGDDDKIEFKKVFDNFFSGFHGSCITVLFKHVKVHESVCKVLRLGLDLDVDDKCKWMLLKDGNEVMNFGPDLLCHYGAEAFPFDKRSIERVDKELMELKKGWKSLEAVLRCNDSSPNYVYKVGTPEELVPLSNLTSKHFWLFLCGEGSLIPELVEMIEQCRAVGHDFDVVMVYMPSNAALKIDTATFQRNIDGLLQNHVTCESWWHLPFDNSVSLRLRRLIRDYNNACNTHDYVAVVGSGIERLDLNGAEVMKCFGLQAYPFTKEAAVKNLMKDVLDIKIEMLLEGGVYRNRKLVHLEELKSNMTFVYVDSIRDDCLDLKMLVPIYNEMKRLGYELVFVESGATAEGVDCNGVTVEGGVDCNGVTVEGGADCNELEEGVASFDCPTAGSVEELLVISDEELRKLKSNTPWYIYPTVSQSLATLMSVIGESAGLLVGFGDGGLLCSITCVDSSFSLEDLRSDYNLDVFFKSLVNAKLAVLTTHQ